MRYLAVLLTALCVLIPRPSHADALPSYGLPSGPAAPSLFPAGTKKTIYQASVSNLTIDCSWYFICSGGIPEAPNFHATDADTLDRQDGWAQVMTAKTKVVRKGKHRTQSEQWIVVPSTFGAGMASVPVLGDLTFTKTVSLPDNQAAAEDFAVAATAGPGLKADASAPNFVPAGVSGGQYAYAGRYQGIYFAAFAVYEGNDREIEAVGVCVHCGKAGASETHATTVGLVQALAQVGQ